ncbi:MAG: hypothetical protein ABJB12_22965 [Pseudomonadota bacterium]
MGFSLVPPPGRAARIRLLALVALLAMTVLGAVYDMRSRRARTAWERPVEVAVALAELGAVEPNAVVALRERFPALEARLATEYHRYGGRLAQPVHFTIFGPVAVDRAPPPDPDASLSSLARHAYEQWRWTHAVDVGSKLPARSYDSRIYVLLRAPREAHRDWVEGSSELGGRVGVARIDLDKTVIDLALFVITHEFFHTLGASDKYDAAGRALIPDGLVEPRRAPLYPQRYAEVMTRNLVLAPGLERPPDSLSELGVGLGTATEIGWLGSNRPK